MMKQTTNKQSCPKIYVSGKITGKDNYKEVFTKAEDTLLRLGFAPISPVKAFFEEFTYQDFICVDLAILSRCDGIYMIDGWGLSEGAKLEWRFAKAMGIPIYYSEEDLIKAKDG